MLGSTRVDRKQSKCIREQIKIPDITCISKTTKKKLNCFISPKKVTIDMNVLDKVYTYPGQVITIN